MRKIFKYIYLLPLFLVASCTFSEGLSLDEVLKVSNTTFEFDKSATSQTLEIESYCSWDLKCDASWLTFSVTKRGEGKVKNTLSVIENESPIVRSAVAEIYNEDYTVLCYDCSIKEISSLSGYCDPVYFKGVYTCKTKRQDFKWDGELPEYCPRCGRPIK